MSLANWLAFLTGGCVGLCVAHVKLRRHVQWLLRVVDQDRELTREGFDPLNRNLGRLERDWAHWRDRFNERTLKLLLEQQLFERECDDRIRTVEVGLANGFGWSIEVARANFKAAVRALEEAEKKCPSEDGQGEEKAP